MSPEEFAQLDLSSLPSGDLAFFLPPDAAAAIARVRGTLNALGPLLSPYELPPDKMLHLYLARTAEARR